MLPVEAKLVVDVPNGYRMATLLGFTADHEHVVAMVHDPDTEKPSLVAVLPLDQCRRMIPRMEEESDLVPGETN